MDMAPPFVRLKLLHPLAELCLDPIGCRERAFLPTRPIAEEITGQINWPFRIGSGELFVGFRPELRMPQRLHIMPRPV